VKPTVRNPSAGYGTTGRLPLSQSARDVPSFMCAVASGHEDARSRRSTALRTKRDNVEIAAAFCAAVALTVFGAWKTCA